MIEEWRVIPGFEGLYLVSSLGRVKSVKRDLIMAQLPDSGGYVKVRLSLRGKKYNKTIHRLVAECFIPSEIGKPHVNHKNGNKKDNVKDNLEWCTPKENTNHRSRILRKTKWEYFITCPDGTHYTTNNLSEFCEIHSLNLSSLVGVVSGNRNSSFGWTGSRRRKDAHARRMAEAGT